MKFENLGSCSFLGQICDGVFVGAVFFHRFFGVSLYHLLRKRSCVTYKIYFMTS